jgi:hypothetical protein
MICLEVWRLLQGVAWVRQTRARSKGGDVILVVDPAYVAPVAKAEWHRELEARAGKDAAITNG